MYLIRLIFSILILSTASTVFAGSGANCPSELPFPSPSQESLDCDYYLYREAAQSCGEKSYFKGFGYKFCKAFQDHRPFIWESRSIDTSFSNKAKLWYTQVGICLQNKLHNKSLERVAQNKDLLTCQAVSDFAIDSHPNCYLQPNIIKYPKLSVCNLEKGDRRKIAWVIKSTFLNLKIIGQIIKVLSLCYIEK